MSKKLISEVKSALVLFSNSKCIEDEESWGYIQVTGRREDKETDTNGEIFRMNKNKP